MNVKLTELELAFQFASSSADFGSEAFLNLENGEFIYVGDAVDDEPPVDLYDSKKYLCVPIKRDLDLGKNLAIQFVEEIMPNDIDNVYSIFRSKGAYSKFKRLLSEQQVLDKWFEYEELAHKEALLNWCEENGIGCDT